MTVNAIIAEYNPLHKGHEYLIKAGREITGADYTVVIMSGNYVQRGEPAIMDKSLRTEAAIISGADLVIELPLYYSVASAEYFAKGAVALIDSLGICDNLVFGCETDDIDLLIDIAKLSTDYEKEMYERIVQYMSEGNSYPKAQSLAIVSILHHLDENSSDMSNDCVDAHTFTIDIDEEYPAILNYSRDDISEILASPNSTLAICYLKAMLSLNARLNPVAVKRISSDYHDTSVGALSSSAIRKELLESNYSPLKDQLSPEIYDLMEENLDITYPIYPDDFSNILLYKLRSLIYGNGNRLKASAIISLTEYLDVSETLAARIVNNINEYRSFTQFVALIKTKSVTYSHISRALLHIILGVKKSKAVKYINSNYALYARILGFRKSSSEILSALKEGAQIPVISKLADAEDLISDPIVLRHLYETVNADELYSCTASSILNCEFTPEFSKKIVIIE